MKVSLFLIANFFLGACSSIASNSEREEAVYYLKEVQSALAASSNNYSNCLIGEYSDRSKDIINSVLLASGDNIINWRREKYEEINAIDIFLNIDDKRLIVSVDINNNKCKEFELYWIVD